MADKYVLALKCLNAAAAIAPNHPKVHEQTIALRHALNQATDLPAPVVEAIKEEFKTIDSSANLKQINDEFETKNKSSPRYYLAALRAKKILGEDKAKTDGAVAGVLNIPGVEFADALEGLKTLQEWRSDETEVFKKAAHAKWPEVTRLA